MLVKDLINKLNRINGNNKEINELKDVLDVIAKTKTVRCGKTLTKVNGLDVDKLVNQTTSYL